MNRRLTSTILIGALSFLPACRELAQTNPAMTPVLTWKQLPSLPDREGFAGSFAGVAGGALLIAGGANFPDKRPWEGGTKIWYDHVFALATDASTWIEAGHLPTPSGYGASISVPEGFVMIGGGDAKRNFADVWLARWDGKHLSFEAWPKLPVPLAMCAGALVGRKIYVAGGIDRPDAVRPQSRCFTLDLEQRAAGWRELPACPGPARILAVGGGLGSDFFLLGGAGLFPDAENKPQREWLRDAWRYSPNAGWKRLADLPRVAVAAPSPAPLVDGKLLVLGGDDGSQISVAPAAHRGFPRDVLAYDPATDAWTRLRDLPFSLVTTPAVMWRGQIVIPGGEAKPGIRAPAVWAATTTAGAQLK